MKKVFVSISIIFFMIIVLVLYIRIVAIPREELHNITKEQIYDFKNNITSDKMRTFIVNKQGFTKEIKDIKIEQLADLIKQAKFGGVGHPVPLGSITFRENKEKDFFEIQIYFEVKEDRKIVYFYISKYINDREIVSIPFNNPEMISWAYDNGLFK